jgi:hypothetical protein
VSVSLIVVCQSPTLPLKRRAFACLPTGSCHIDALNGAIVAHQWCINRCNSHHFRKYGHGKGEARRRRAEKLPRGPASDVGKPSKRNGTNVNTRVASLQENVREMDTAMQLAGRWIFVQARRWKIAYLVARISVLLRAPNMHGIRTV